MITHVRLFTTQQRKFNLEISSEDTFTSHHTFKFFNLREKNMKQIILM